jgi:hypothetical protein
MKNFYITVDNASMGSGYTTVNNLSTYPISAIPVKKNQIFNIYGDDYCADLHAYPMS